MNELLHFAFDAILDDNQVLDHASGERYSVIGYADLVDGIHDNALRFDGYTTHIALPRERLADSLTCFTITAWIANGAYPWHEAPIIENYDDDNGFFLGMTSEGRIRFTVRIDGDDAVIESEEDSALATWHFVAAVFDAAEGLTLSVDGSIVDVLHFDSPRDPVRLPEESLFIGRAAREIRPTNGVSNGGHFPCAIYLDSVLADVRVHRDTLSPERIGEMFAEAGDVGRPPLAARGLPKLPASTDRFGAYYTTLEYSKEWDRLWRVRDHADIVVLFDQVPVKYVFWRGCNYISAWVTENGIWYTNEFNETWADSPGGFDVDISGCAEPMSDKQCRTAHVRIIESNDARVIVHWRYALVDTHYRQARPDPITGWGDWSDEYYVIYPDGVGIRDITLHSSTPLAPHEFQESIVILGEGQTPLDVYDMDAVTFFNLKGESYSYNWENRAPLQFSLPRGKNIQVINVRSEYVPFLAVPDGPCTVAGKIFNGKKRRTPGFWPYAFYHPTQLFPWWNSWPVADIPTDGRFATKADRPSHTNVSSMLEWEDYDVGPTHRRRIMMHGLWEKRSISGVVDMARSWLEPPSIRVDGPGFRGGEYVPHERAYHLEIEDVTGPCKLSFTVEATAEQPMRNLALVIDGLDAELELSVNGEDVPRGPSFRFGVVYTMEGKRTVVWIQHSAIEPTHFRIRIGGGE